MGKVWYEITTTGGGKIRLTKHIIPGGVWPRERSREVLGPPDGHPDQESALSAMRFDIAQSAPDKIISSQIFDEAGAIDDE